jgi:hypothetical protein
VTEHISEDDLTLYYYGEGRRREAIERHIDHCGACSTLYREIAGTLALLTEAETPERGDQYGAEVWQRIRGEVGEKGFAGFGRFDRFARFGWFSGLGVAGAMAVLLIAAFVGGRVWQRSLANLSNGSNLSNPANPSNASNPSNQSNLSNPSNLAADSRQRILYASVADHLDRSERMLTDIMNTSGHADISTEQRWASDLLDTSRLYRQDAVDAGEQSVAGVLDELERSLLEIVHSPSRISAADLEQMRRRIDAAALLFKVRVMSDELRQHEQPPERSRPRTSTPTIS